MNIQKVRILLENKPHLKKIVLNAVMHPIKTRPRLWVRFFQFIYIKKGKGSVIYRNVRKDITPFNKFVIDHHSVVESYSVLNNAVGDIFIGSNSRIGMSNTIIGPVSIGNNVNLAQNVVLSGLNHNYEDIEKNIDVQGVSKNLIKIENNVWIGANVVILAGITIGTHSCVGAGSVVTKNIPPYTVVAGNPARIIKKFDFQKKEWVRI